MNTKHLKSIMVSLSLVRLAATVALAQPVITVQPADQFLGPGQSAHFRVSVTGVVPFSYQWLFDGMPIAGANTSSLVVSTPQPAQFGSYWIIVSNASGSITSQVARLKLFLPTPTAHSLSSLQVSADRTASLTFTGETTLPFASLYPTTLPRPIARGKTSMC